MKKSKDTGLIVALVFAAVVVSGSFVYFGMSTFGAAQNLSDSEIDKKIDAGIERYVQKKTAEVEQAQADAVARDAEQTKEMAKNMPPVSKTGDHIYGNVDAPVSIVEYSDFQCPFCKKFHGIAKQVIDAYGGKVNWVYRHYPLPGHDPIATNQAMATECVAEQGGNASFWTFTDVLYDKNLTTEDQMALAVVELGLNESQFRECLKSQKYLSKVQQELEEGTNAGVRGTPGNIVVLNSTGEAVLIEGAQGVPVFQKVIDPLLSQ